MSHQTFGTPKYDTPPEDMLKAMQDAVNKLRGMPPANWMLVAPYGRTWADADPAQLARILLAQINTTWTLTGD